MRHLLPELLVFHYSSLFGNLEGVEEQCVALSSGPLHLAYLVRHLCRAFLMVTKCWHAPVTVLGYQWLRAISTEARCISVLWSSSGWCVRFLTKNCSLIRFTFSRGEQYKSPVRLRDKSPMRDTDLYNGGNTRV